MHIMIIFYLILMATVTCSDESRSFLNLPFKSQPAKSFIVSKSLLSSTIAQMESSIDGKLLCTTLIADRSQGDVGIETIRLIQFK